MGNAMNARLSRSAVGTIWSDVLTAAINLPADHPGREQVILTLDAAAYTATQAVPAMFTDQWYVRALASIRSADPVAKRQINAMVSNAYATAHGRISK